MFKPLVVLLTASLSLGAMMCCVNAREARYEIDGQRYSFDTNNRQQAAQAWQRINAATAAYRARAKASAELAANPLVGVFGSEAQREANEAQARLELIMRQSPPTAQRQIERGGAAQHRPPTPQNSGIPERRPAVLQAQGPTAKRDVADQPREAQPRSQEDAVFARGPQHLAVTWISFDLQSGIKTVHLDDGTVHEEPFDPSAFENLGSTQPRDGTLIDFVDRIQAAN